MRKVLTGLVVGVAVGGVVAVVLLPEARQRALEIGTRLTEPGGLARLAADVRQLGRRAADDARARVQLALAEARQTSEETQRDLWAKLEIAKQRGRMPS